LILAILLPVRAEAPANRSLEDSSNESSSDRLKALQESLVLANAEAEFFRQQWQELRLKNEALGVEALTVDEKRLEEKVVQSVRELYQTEKQRREALGALEKLTVATQKVLKGANGVDAQARAEYEVALRTAREVLSGKGKASIPLGSDLSNGQIVDLNPQLNAVILNLGSAKDVKVGMPFRVLRGNQVIGRVKVFQTREQVSAALVEGVQKEFELKVGDRVAVAAEK
jgi:hypothetical protein